MTRPPAPPSIYTPTTQRWSLLLSWLNPLSIIRIFLRNRNLIWNLTKREIQSVYQGSFLGVLWTLILPLMMLLIYTFVFSVIFQARWGNQQTGNTPQGEFALILFAGITPFNLFSTVINRAPNMILAVPNYVKKVIFPLEILPMVVLGSALFTSLINVGLILIGSLFVYHRISLSVWLLPLAYIPLLLFSLGFSWFLASLGVFIRDVGQAISVIVQILFFMTPIFYSVDAVPENFRILNLINPLSYVIDSFRRVLIWDKPIDWATWGVVTFSSIVVAMLGFAWFSATRKGFADVM